MDQVKIGKYIAEKRKNLGYTQVQLAEKLGMSDKSVSKWERGVCLPDVSVYESLCDELGISLNEFLAGEDIAEEKVIKKSEENLLKASWFIKKKSTGLKKTIAVFVVLIILLIGLFVGFLYSEGYLQQNYIEAYFEDSEMVRLLSEREGAFLYEYHVDDKHELMNIKMTTYRNGVAYEEPVELPFGAVNEGVILFVPDVKSGKINVIFTAGAGAVTTESYFECDKIVSDEYSTFCWKLESKQKIEQGKETAILVLIYDKDGHMSSSSIEKIEENPGEAFKENDLCYYFTVTFDEAENQVLE